MAWWRSGRPLLAAALVGGSPAVAAPPIRLGERPPFVYGTPSVAHYDGVSDDLLTAGLGAAGLGSSTPPAYADPANPTAAELRRAAIYGNYRALVDPTPGGGYGTFYGPNVAADGTVTRGSGKVAGTEWILLTKVPSSYSVVLSNVTVVVQVPDSYDRRRGCIVAAPSSGSRGPYGAIATAGEWGLKHGCAVAYTDKGSGIGADDLQNDTVNLLRGQRAGAEAAGGLSNFTARLTEAQRAAFDARLPNRFAFKHAHGQADPEADWGLYVQQAVQVAFWLLNQRYAPEPAGRASGQTSSQASGQAAAAGPYPISRANTLVIASSVSNGGGASLRAVEQDASGLFDGVAVAEPNVQPVYAPAFAIQQGGGAPLVRHSLSLIDYITLENLYAGCAAAQPGLKAAPLNLAPSPGRCDALAAAGLLTPAPVAAEAAQAQAVLNGAGILPEQNVVSPSHWYAYVHQSIAVTYANAYGKFGAADDLCGYSFGATDASGAPQPLAPNAEAALFAASNGIPPGAGVSLIDDLAPSGPKEDRLSTPDQDLRGALCLRGLATGRDAASGARLAGPDAFKASRVAAGVQPVRASGALRGVPAIWVTGRDDGVLPPNFTSRPYYGLTQIRRGNDARYYEVTNAQHLDTFNQFPGFDTTLVPLHVYFLRAMDLMLAHLRDGAPLPASQVVHTVPRGPGAPPLAAANVPPIAAAPAEKDRIVLRRGVLAIPD